MANVKLRGRTVYGEFWEDPEMARLSLAERMVYVLLWQAADDSGWMPWDLDSLAWLARIPADELRSAVEAIRSLPGDQRVEVAECGRHARLDRPAKHQPYAKSGHAVVRHQTAHQRECLGQDVPGPGTRPTGAVDPSAPDQAPDKPPTSPAQAPLVTVTDTVTDTVTEGEQRGNNGNGTAPPTNPAWDGNLHRYFAALTGKQPSPKQQRALDGYVRLAGGEGPPSRRVVAECMAAEPDPGANGWLGRVGDRVKQRRQAGSL